MGKSSKQSDPKVDAAVPSFESSKVGTHYRKRKGEGEHEKQVSAKKQKRDEVAEKRKNVKDTRSDDSSSYSEQEQKSAKNGTLSTREEKGNPATSSCSEFSDDDSNKDNQNPASNAQKLDSKTVEKDTSSDISDGEDDEDDNDDDDDNEKPHMVKKPVKDYESSEDSEDETEEKSFETPQKRVKDVDMVDAVSIEKKAPKVPATLKVQNATSKKICVRNLSYSVERADMENLFNECGEIVDVHLHTDNEGRFKGFGHVLFATAEAAQKALELDNTELLRRPIKVNIWEKGEYTPRSSNLSKTFQTGGRVQFQTTSVAGLNKSLTEERVKDVEMVDAASIEKNAPETQATLKVQNATSNKICVRNLSYSVERADLENLFKECGEIVDVHLYTDSEGRFKGFGHVLFATAAAAQKALELDNTELLRRPIKVSITWEKGGYTPKGSSLSKTFLTDGSVQIQTTSAAGFNKSLTEEKVKGVEMVDASSIEKKAPETSTTLKVQNATSKKISVRNLSYSVERADMENMFKECGEIVDVRLHEDNEGRSRGFGHVLFATPEAAQKALELDNTELLRRPIKVDISWEKGEYTPKGSNLGKTFQMGGRGPFQTTSVVGFNKSLTDEKVKDVEVVDAASIEKKAPETQATLKVQSATSKKIYVRNLSYRAEPADMENLFKECGEIVDVRLHKDSEGRSRGFGHVLFATEEAAQKALELDNTELLRRPIRVDIALEKGEYTPNSRNLSKTFQTGGRGQFQTTSVVGYNKSLTEEKPETQATPKVQNATSKKICVRNLSYRVEPTDMENLFKECGEIVDMRLHTDSEGRSRGFGHVLFATEEAAQKALELDNTELFRRPIKVDIAWEKGEYTPNRSYLSKTFQMGGSGQFQTTSVVDFNKSLTEEKPEIQATLKVQNATSKKICVRNLPYRVEPADMENLFKECGEIVDVRLQTDSEGRSRGFGFVLFATEEAAQKALELDNTELLRRPIKVHIAWEKGEYTANSSKTFQTGGRGQFQTSVAGFNKSVTEEKVKDVEVVDAALFEKKAAETQATLQVQNATSKKICVRNLSYGVEPADMENLFKECGEIVDVRLHTDSEGRPRGFGHVLFATEEASKKALELDNTELLRRPIKVDIAWENGGYTPWSRTLQTGARVQFQTIFVAGFNKSLPEEEIKASLEEHFSSCGEITRISIPKDHHSGAVKGFAHLDFKDVDSFMKALRLNKTEIGGYYLSVEKAKPLRGGHQFGRRDGGNQAIRGRWRSGDCWRH